MAPPRDQARLRHGLNPPTTSSPAGNYRVHANSIIPALSMASSHMAQSARTPASAIQPYNPQEWVPSPSQMPDGSRQYVVESGQASVLPPPPYSPPRNRQQQPISTAFEHAVVPNSTPVASSSSSSSRLPMTPHDRTYSETPGSPAFPPPPGVGGRGNSRERRFGLTALGRKKEPELPQSNSPDSQALALHQRRSAEPTAFHEEPQYVLGSTPSEVPRVAPPAARRAASTGAIDDSSTVQRSRSASQTRWEPGMPLPPPPPGPPPSSSRSQSVQSVGRSSVPIISPPTRRPPPEGVTCLGPVPPTPADWVEGVAQPSRPGPTNRSQPSRLIVDTAAAADAINVPETPGSSNSIGGLSRAKAVRSDKTIIQRRAESKSRQPSNGSIDVVTQPHQMANLVVSSGLKEGTRTAVAHQGRNANRRDGEFLPRTGESLTYESRNSTPRGPDSARPEQVAPFFSPDLIETSSTPTSLPVAASSKALFGPPPQTISASSSRARDSSRPPIAPSTVVSQQIVVGQTAKQFAAATVERMRDFAAKEAQASSDAQRVRLFADFIVSESRIRRERFSTAIGVMGSEIFDLTRDLFRPMEVSSRRDSETSHGQWTPATTEGDGSRRDSASSAARVIEGLSASAPTSANPTTPPSSAPPPGNANWAANYMPSLSPILSMSVSDHHENGSSRGRPSSRWWETGSQGELRMFERSKRESKYMGVQKDQWFAEEQGSGARTSRSDHGSSFDFLTEKEGWHDQGEPSMATPQYKKRLSEGSSGDSNLSSSTRDRPEVLDISRLVTLPPPYPRHHPAVNNNHPQLTAIRTSVRALADLSEIANVKESFSMISSKRRDAAAKAASDCRQTMMANLQTEIRAGNMGYADAAVIESEFKDQEGDRKQELEKEEYENFQRDVVLPLNDLLTGRVTKVTDLFNDLAKHLFDNGEMDADMPQEEGDDRPELLEKLTLLKWVFEAQESLHRAIYDVLSERNARYRQVVMTPYRLSGNPEKVKSVEAFFVKDASKREHSISNEALDRARRFQCVVEEAVERGVALQLSAFWDIAPPLRRVLESIPLNLDGFSIQIPASEYAENPAYLDHPLQYLYSLLMHAEKSTYQFIEAHTNLLCLLHEVREAVVSAQAKVLESQVEEADGTTIGGEEREQRAQALRERENQRLTEDLKERVEETQDQWSSALGEGIRNVKDRTGDWLLSTGGWDETLEENAVFSGV